jgi:hypothetical protein
MAASEAAASPLELQGVPPPAVGSIAKEAVDPSRPRETHAALASEQGKGRLAGDRKQELPLPLTIPRGGHMLTCMRKKAVGRNARSHKTDETHRHTGRTRGAKGSPRRRPPKSAHHTHNHQHNSDIKQGSWKQGWAGQPECSDEHPVVPLTRLTLHPPFRL